MKRRITAFAFAAVLATFGCRPVLNVLAEPVVRGKNLLHEMDVVIQGELAESFQNYVQCEETEDFCEGWRLYSIGNPVREYKA